MTVEEEMFFHNVVGRRKGVSSKYRQLNTLLAMVEQVSDMGRRAHVQ